MFVYIILFSIVWLGYNTIVWSHKSNFQIIWYSKFQNLIFEKLRWTHWWLAFSHGLFLCTSIKKRLRLMISLCFAWIYKFSYIVFALRTASSFICDRRHVVLDSNYNIWLCIYYFIFDRMFRLQYYCLFLQLNFPNYFIF